MSYALARISQRVTAALVWKEWRENRSILFAGLAVAGGIPAMVAIFALASSGTPVAEALGDVGLSLMVTMVWPLFAALFGAVAFGNESAGKTMDFLVSRPVSRARVWVVKVGAAAAGLVLVMATSAALIFIFAVRLDRYFVPSLLSNFTWALVVVLLLFSTALLASSWTSQPLAAVAAGGLLSGVTFVAVPFMWNSWHFYGRVILNWLAGSNASVFRPDLAREMALQMALAAAVFLLISLWRFAGDELSEAIRRRVAESAGAGEQGPFL